MIHYEGDQRTYRNMHGAEQHSNPFIGFVFEHLFLPSAIDTS